MEHRLVKQGGEKQDGAAVYHQPQHDKGDDGGVVGRQVAVHPDKGHHRNQHKGALKTHELDNEHRRRDARGATGLSHSYIKISWFRL